MKWCKKKGDKHWEPYKSFRTAFETACRHAKLSGVTPHVLRHTFASRLVMRGADLRAVQELGGWKSLNMVQRYAHLSQEYKRKAIELLSENSPSLITTPVENAPKVGSYNIKLINGMGR
jgi:integrase